MQNRDFNHKSVMLNEVLANLDLTNKGIYIDATFGAGGYSKAILEANNENEVIAFDRDATVKKIAELFKEKYQDRFAFYNKCFSEIKNINFAQDITAIIFDLGVSSMQLDDADRGFSFNKKAKLDMRMGNNSISAYEVVNEFKEEELANILYRYSDEKYARIIAKNICAKRQDKPIKFTTELADIIAKTKNRYFSKTHPATKSFQAIRIYVNQELEELENALEAAKLLLKTNGKLIIVSFHSLEDRIVKNFLKKYANNENVNRYAPITAYNKKPLFKITVNGQKTSKEEVESNIRARSAILRAAVRL
jgi:16S rRNA (cytosine1402-N4)-methyltransferase